MNDEHGFPNASFVICFYIFFGYYDTYSIHFIPQILFLSFVNFGGFLVMFLSVSYFDIVVERGRIQIECESVFLIVQR